MTMKKVVLGVLALAMAGTCWGQKEPESFRSYRFDFTLQETEQGKVVNSRSYSAVVKDSGNASIRSGTRVPASLNKNGEQQYIDIGLNVDVRAVHESEGRIYSEVTADASSLAKPDVQVSGLPLVRQNRWSGSVAADLRKPTVLFSSDDSTSPRRFQLELTVTPLNGGR